MTNKYILEYLMNCIGFILFFKKENETFNVVAVIKQTYLLYITTKQTR